MPMLARIYYYSGLCAKISFKFYGFYGQTGIFQRFVRKFLAIMMRIYGQTGIFGSFVRKIRFEASEFLRTNGHF